MYTTNDNIPSCYDDTKSKYIFSAAFLLIDVPSITHMEPISTLTGSKNPTAVVKLEECKSQSDALDILFIKQNLGLFLFYLAA